MNKRAAAAIALTLAFALFVSGYFFGRQYTGDGYYIRTDKAAPAETAEIGEKININTAGEPLLATLPGIGEIFARKIVRYREINGDFKTVKDLTRVSGIRASAVEAIEELITVG